MAVRTTPPRPGRSAGWRHHPPGPPPARPVRHRPCRQRSSPQVPPPFCRRAHDGWSSPHPPPPRSSHCSPHPCATDCSPGRNRLSRSPPRRGRPPRNPPPPRASPPANPPSFPRLQPVLWSPDRRATRPRRTALGPRQRHAPAPHHRSPARPAPRPPLPARPATAYRRLPQDSLS